MKAFLILFVSFGLTFAAKVAYAKKDVRTVYRKTQQVDFDATDVNGVARSPDGAYVAQKRAVKFLPLYHVKLNFDHAIKQSVEFVR